jgi:hypothetical protein
MVYDLVIDCADDGIFFTHDISQNQQGCIYGTFMWYDGGIYDGGWDGCNFHGVGIYNLLLPEGALYKGQWFNGQRHGLGTQLTPDYILKGTFIRDTIDTSKKYILYERTTTTTNLDVVSNLRIDNSLVKYFEGDTLYFGLKGDDGCIDKGAICCGYKQVAEAHPTGAYFKAQNRIRTVQTLPSEFTNDYKLPGANLLL